MQGKPIQEAIPGRSVRAATESDIESCNATVRQFMVITEMANYKIV